MKKCLKVIFVIIVLLIVGWMTIFLVDYNKCSNFEMPVFINLKETRGQTNVYQGLGYTVEVEKVGDTVLKIEMYIFDRFVTGAIADLASNEQIPIVEHNFELNFHQRKDMGAEKIIDKTVSDYDFDIYTIGGDVTVTVDGDMVYELKTALDQKILTIDDILKKAKQDSLDGICKDGFYSDGGTTEYQYEKYTLIKYNTLDGNIDFVVGPPGTGIRNKIDKVLYEK